MENTKFLIETNRRTYYCDDCKSLNKTIKALKFLGIDFVLYYQLKEKYVRSLTDLEEFLNKFDKREDL